MKIISKGDKVRYTLGTIQGIAVADSFADTDGRVLVEVQWDPRNPPVLVAAGKLTVIEPERPAFEIDGVAACGAPVDGGRCGRRPGHGPEHPHIMEPGSDTEPVSAEIYCCQWIFYPEPGTDSICPGCGSRFSVSPAITSEAAYEAAAARFNEISETIGPRTRALHAEIDALEAEWEAAQAALRAHELKPGIPLWPTLPGGPRASKGAGK